MGAPISRRGLLRASAGAAAGLALASCGDGGPAIPLADNAKVELPDYVPYKGVKPALAGTKDGVLNGYRHYPADPARAFPEGPPAKGPGVRVMTLTFNPVPPPQGRNPYWRALNEQLGTDLDVEIVPVGDYPNKFSVVVAGGDLPDAMLVLPTASQQPAMFNALFEDLTEHLSGPAVREYPYLANIPTDAWRWTVYNGGIYALPMPRANAGSIMFYRSDRFKERELDPNPGDFKEFQQLCRDVSDPKHSRYALGDPITTLNFMMEMVGGPNIWREENGKFTFWLESEEIKEALDAARKLTQEHLLHPDAYSVVGKFKDWFGNGQIALHYDGNAGWNDFYRQYAQNNKGLEIDGMLAPGFDGGKGSHWAGYSSFAVLAIKKAPKSRVRQILRLANAMAAPFGTDAYKLRKYGIEGHDHERRGTDPILTPDGTTETALPTGFITDAPLSLYFPERPDVVDRQHSFQTRAAEVLVRNPTEGIYSETNAKTFGALKLKTDDVLKGIMQGRNKLSSLDETVRMWRREGGDQMRAEYEKAWASLHG
ncbi:extracellular solute-binding protein [Streptomyces sp. DSM 41982]|uniref:Extracellular solute-binding protein n=1 Tax=Streptomyces evansiae TaxID=3075535 RepID=A0ABD5ED65_9ACTN|nr:MULTISPECIES: extracellular solute-binding protein [unclassified Streptomyces]MDT0418517.1 extracellular solute-binding protein [Streptomyces sp. DSM 41982]SCE37445.1 carbohydrate ABC transporter substrate-binding protein, CUT1 family [Streptomyces sp. SolWspMP-sol7th]